jgi:exopolysaccharide biosynthesis protein
VVVVDGRQEHSQGLSLQELALFMQQLGCVDALNIGGGGCTTLCIDGKLINSPSADMLTKAIGQERPVSEALCLSVNELRSIR